MKLRTHKNVANALVPFKLNDFTKLEARARSAIAEVGADELIAMPQKLFAFHLRGTFHIDHL